MTPKDRLEVWGFTETPNVGGAAVGIDSPAAASIAICDVLPEGGRGAVVAIMREFRGLYTKYETEKECWSRSLQLAAKMAAAPAMETALGAAVASMKEAVSSDPPKDWKDSLRDSIDCCEAALKKTEVK